MTTTNDVRRGIAAAAIDSNPALLRQLARDHREDFEEFMRNYAETWLTPAERAMAEREFRAAAA